MGGAGETRKGFLVLETNYKVYAYTCESTESSHWGLLLVLIRKMSGISQRAGDCHPELVYRYPDAISEFDRRAVRERYCEGRHEEWDHCRSGSF